MTNFGNYQVIYSDDSYSNITFPYVVIDNISNKDNDYYFADAQYTIGSDGHLYAFGGIATGGYGNDTYYVDRGDYAAIYDGSNSTNDYLKIDDYSYNLQYVAAIENHIFIRFSDTFISIYYGLTNDGLIENIEFKDGTLSYLNTSTTAAFVNNYQSLFNNFWQQYYDLGLLNSPPVAQPTLLDLYNAGLITNIPSITGYNSYSEIYDFINNDIPNLVSLSEASSYNYLASNTDLISAFGSDINSASNHYFLNGISEGRPESSFDAWKYLASNPDLISAFGTNTYLATKHFVQNGFAEGRVTTNFDVTQYFSNYQHLATAFNNDSSLAIQHYVTNGYLEGRNDSPLDPPPLITGPSGSAGDGVSTISIKENNSAIHTFSADETVTWSISGGIDKDLFTINTNTGLLSFKTAPDYENPTDTDKNNSYLVTVRATDIAGITSDQIVTTVVTDVGSNDWTEVDSGDASFSISGTVAVGNTLSINEDTADPDGTGTLSYSWQTYSDDSTWTVVGTNSTYTIGTSEEGKSIRVVLSYTDGQGFNEKVTTRDSLVSPSASLITLSNAIYDDNYFRNTITPIYQDYLDGQSKIPFYIHPGGDYQQVGGKTKWTLDTSFYKEFIVNLFNRIDNLIDIDFELWNHYNGSLIDIYAIEYDPYLGVLGSAYPFRSEKYIDIEFNVYDDIRENYLTIVHEVGHALGLSHPDGDGFNSNYTIKDTMMSYNGDPSLEEIWFSDADIYTLQSLYGLETDIKNGGNASFSIVGNTAIGNMLSINENTADPDGTGTLSYSWQTSSDDSTWTVVGTNSTYTIGTSEEGKSIRAVLTYTDGQGFYETVTTASSRTVDTTAPTLSDLEALKYIASNPDLISAFGIDTSAAASHYTNHGISEGRGFTSFSTTDYLAKYSDLASAFGNDETLALQHYIQSGYAEGRTDSSSTSGSGSTTSSPTALTDFEALNYVASHADLISVFGTDTYAASSHYVNSGYAEGRAKDDFDEWGYLASNTDLMTVLGSNTTEAIKHYISYGKSEGRSTNLFNAEIYLNVYGDLRAVFGNDHALATKHYVESGFNEGRLF